MKADENCIICNFAAKSLLLLNPIFKFGIMMTEASLIYMA